ncbi:MAG: transglutaminase domain protein [Candidatus Scalindua rubra]|uniref:Transglutaminase domain protein n=1 Tax=Candidatus Scalindua rubra TaxID=1872076 RepID=A0A1E3X979_9BACT|nr:MAG: transglutaminase domain protein [Candidatus Scalindua rubra]
MINLSFTIGHDPYPSERLCLAGERLLPERLDQASDLAGEYSHLGYKPVPDECPYLEDGKKLYDNFLYKEWCEETFKNGNYIYEAYKDIAFNIKYTSELNKTDFWQTPLETIRLKKGDCEDAVFLFFSQIPSNHENAEIVWGWVIDKRNGIARAHVWYQLTDKRGQQYIVEGFSKDWNGIIPMENVENTEIRRPILTISHSTISKLASFLPKADDWQTYQSLLDLFTPTSFSNFDSDGRNPSQDINTWHHHFDYEFIEHLLNTQDKSQKPTTPQRYTNHKMITNTSKEICNIFKKLQELFSRYKKQKEAL